jgi:MYXO-CTERM domain-containing protein
MTMTLQSQIAAARGALGAAAALAAATLIPASAAAGIFEWNAAVSAGSPATFTATNIFTPSIQNIGALSGDITYEFIVNGKDRAAAGSLIGALTGGQHEAIRFEQWHNTGAYGATLYFVDDYNFGVATTYDADVALAFVVNGAANKTTLFVNGVDTGTTVPFALTLQGPVAFGGTSMPGGGFLGDDSFEGVILGFAAYDSALAPDELKAHADAFFAVPEPATPATWAIGLAGLFGLVARRRSPGRGARG